VNRPVWPRLFAGGGSIRLSPPRPTNYWRIRVVSPNEPLKPSNDQPSTCRSVLPSLRAVVVSTIASLSILVSFLGLFLGQAVAGPLLGDDVATCRERQTDFKARLDACERIIAAGQSRGRIWPLRLPCAARGFSQKRDTTRRSRPSTPPSMADPENIKIVNGRGWGL